MTAISICRDIIKWAASFIRRFVLPPLPAKAHYRTITGVLYFAGVFTAMPPVPSTDPFSWTAAGTIATGAWMLGVSSRKGAGWRIARCCGVVLTVMVFLCLLHLAWLELMLFGWVAGWPTRCLLAFLAAAAISTAAWKETPLCVPAVSFLGFCALLVMMSGPEDGSIRCDDDIRVRNQPGVRILIPTTLEQLKCKPGERLSVLRYPRKLWEAPGGNRFILTSQDRGQIGWGYGGGRPVQSRFTGSFCEARADTEEPLNCLGSGKADMTVDAPEIDRLFVYQWTYDPAERGTVWSVTREEPMRLIEKRDFTLASGGGWYQPGNDALAVGYDEGVRLDFIKGTDLSKTIQTVNRYFQGGFLRYDTKHGEGIMCAAGPLQPIDGRHYLSFAFRGSPFGIRILGSSAIYPWAVATIVWGCDWDPDERTVWLAMTNLGLVIPMHYDTGRLLGGPIAYTPPGVRMVTYDKPRKRLYLGTFTDGEVLAISLEDGRTLGRWFAGRWVRDLVISRNGRYILLTSNLGLVRIIVDSPDKGGGR